MDYSHEIELVELYKEGKITEYVLLQELSNFVGTMSEVRIYEGSKVNTTTSFGIFVIPEAKVNGIKLIYYVDSCALLNLFTPTELVERLAAIAAMKQAILKEVFNFRREHADRHVSFNAAAACLLRIYQGTLSRQYVEDKDFLPSETKIGEIINDFEDEKIGDAELEALSVGNLMPKVVFEVAREMSHESSDEAEIKIKFTDVRELPTINFGHQEIRDLANKDSYNIEKYKEIPYDYKPSTNQ